MQMNHELLATGDVQCSRAKLGKVINLLRVHFVFSFGPGPSNKMTDVCMCLCFPPGSCFEKPFCFSDHLYKEDDEQGRESPSCHVLFSVHPLGNRNRSAWWGFWKRGRRAPRSQVVLKRIGQCPKPSVEAGETHVSQASVRLLPRGPTRGGVKPDLGSCVSSWNPSLGVREAELRCCHRWMWAECGCCFMSSV